jgi:DNA invertase Pin-like site-specific DNA recombinase
VPKHRKIVGYVRVSTKKQIEVGRSLQDQRTSIEDYAVRNNIALAEVLDEGGISGWTLDRPRLEGLRTQVRAGEIETVIVSHVDRYTRNGEHLKELLAELRDAEAYLITVEDRFGTTIAGLDSRKEIDRKILGAIVEHARWQRDRISDATKRALTSLKREGKQFSRDLYGFEVTDDDLIPIPAEIVVLKQIKIWLDAGVSRNEIARKLNAAGHPGKRGGLWQAKQVGDNLRRFEDPDLREFYELHLGV